MKNNLFLFLVCSVACGSAGFAKDEPDLIFPPPMSLREIAPPREAFPGQTNILREGDLEFTLFIPEKWTAPKSGEIALTVHFHGATWFAIQEHLRHGLKTPLIAFFPGEGSGRYQRAFADPERFDRWMKLTTEHLKQKGAPENARITAVSISSYSAGYGAVRELLKSEEYRKLISRIVMADSMYADFATDGPSPIRRPLDSQIDPYISFAQTAARGEKTFVITFSKRSAAAYASSELCAAAIVEKIGGRFKEVEMDSSAAANDPDFPLLKRYDVNNLHIWGYDGGEEAAHMTHARHIADIWRELDAARKP